MVVLHGFPILFSTSRHLHARHGWSLGISKFFNVAADVSLLRTRGLSTGCREDYCNNPFVVELHDRPLPDSESILACSKKLRSNRDSDDHSSAGTREHETLSGMNQIRKVQRRDCRGGGEEYRALSEDHALTGGVAAATTLEARAGGAAKAKLSA